jgi:antitoxin (DNA-binding transcriptional repressor) of toxin-antitoxin stability system
MDTVIGMHEAKSTLSELVQRAAAGETILIGPRGQALVKLTSLQVAQPEQAAKPLRRIGILKGKLKVPDNFNDPLPDDMLELFYGSPDDPIAASAVKATAAVRRSQKKLAERAQAKARRS